MPTPSSFGQNVTHSKTRIANGAVVKYGQVIQDPADSTKAKVPAGQGVASIGIAMENAADGEEFAIADEGTYYLIDKAGSLNNGDPVTTAGTDNFHKGEIAQSADYVNAVVLGPDAQAADDLVLVEINRVPTIL